MDKQNRIENPEIDLYTYSELISGKEAKAINTMEQRQPFQK